MGDLAFLILIAAVGGVAVTLQAQFMGLMTANVGTLESVFITYGSGGLVIGLTMLALRGGNLSALPTTPWWSLLAGMTGLVIVGTVGFAVRRLGLPYAQTLIIAAQLISGVIIYQFGLFGAPVKPLDPPRLLGVGILLLGTWLIVRPG